MTIGGVLSSESRRSKTLSMRTSSEVRDAGEAL
jgi:hypothetical protein